MFLHHNVSIQWQHFLYSIQHFTVLIIQHNCCVKIIQHSDYVKEHSYYVLI